MGRYGLSELLLVIALGLFLVALALALGWFTGGNQAALVDGGLAALAGAWLADARRP